MQDRQLSYQKVKIDCAAQRFGSAAAAGPTRLLPIFAPFLKDKNLLFPSELNPPSRP
jgi:hypothetical protein